MGGQTPLEVKPHHFYILEVKPHHFYICTFLSNYIVFTYDVALCTLTDQLGTSAFLCGELSITA